MRWRVNLWRKGEREKQREGGGEREREKGSEVVFEKE
jgi:hypothetical protein